MSRGLERRVARGSPAGLTLLVPHAAQPGTLTPMPCGRLPPNPSAHSLHPAHINLATPVGICSGTLTSTSLGARGWTWRSVLWRHLMWLFKSGGTRPERPHTRERRER
jgi:hypothetical protein